MDKAAQELKDLAPFCSTDVCRPHMAKPFLVETKDRQWLGATDGHRAGLVHYRYTSAEDFKVKGSPPLGQIASNAVANHQLGIVSAASLRPARQIPRKWGAYLEIGTHGGRLTARWGTGPKNKKEMVTVFSNTPVDWSPHFEFSPRPIGLCIEYLLDAVDFVGTETVYVYGDAKDEYSPVLFTPEACHPLECERFALVMPVRL